ncbi:response regulator transcription factor [Paraglaciecola psychrophila]|uniref:Two component transcriptional regulator, LuxR family n=1 Tax=Paraglaciecola psychrophila 170 TaxID=1129794 RepID=K6ZLA7_9ALTE|nr:response regulator transcription factor [Paraglaciecola psychrophila]AGH44573.1 two component transcriptional regulator, LuxR family [Paraglaciecola psychrophila 170]GAC36751.1 glycerol metabolism activator [Paraglaciecola psychrophila 170]
MAKFLIADDHPLYREALKSALRPLFENVEIIQSDGLVSTLEALQQNSDFDLVLLDLNMPGCDNFYGLIRVSQDFPHVPVAVVSASDSVEVVSKVMSLGAKGFIPKAAPTQTIADALKQIMDGNNWLPEGMETSIEDDAPVINIAKLVGELTPKQFQVLKLLQNGLLNKQIAFDLNITEATVKAHISAVFRKLNVNTRTQAVLLLKNLDTP